jgi:hypothetical protein
MAKITKEDIAIAHQLIRAKDLNGLCHWINLYKVRIDTDVFKETFRKVFLMDPERGFKIFDAMNLEGTDPDVERFVAKVFKYIGCGVSLLVLLGCLGGVVYLFSILFG